MEVFSQHGFRGTTVDEIATVAAISKPNLLYYFPTKDSIYRALFDRLLKTWLDPLRSLNPDGDPIEEIVSYILRKLEMARQYPRESRLFATEVVAGAPHLRDALSGPLKSLVDERCEVFLRWMDDGRLARMEPRHLIFSIWATTQHYADFDVQVRDVLGDASANRYDDAKAFLTRLYTKGLTP